MGSKQEALIYIEKDNITEAEFMSRSFVDKETRNRAYINALGAELGIKYLTSEGFNTKNLHNLHSISKLLEKYDIADILLPNIHIDVRVIFDESQIFIPKSHFKLDMTPDIYIILKLDSNFEHVEFLGFIEPKKINLKNANSEYYFINKNKLNSIDDLKQFIKDFTGTTSRDISEEDMLRGRELSVALADHNTTAEEEKELIELLLSNDALRESVLEFDNFETLAFNVAKTLTERTAIHEENLPAPALDQEDDITTNEEIDFTDTSTEEDILLDDVSDAEPPIEEEQDGINDLEISEETLEISDNEEQDFSEDELIIDEDLQEIPTDEEATIDFDISETSNEQEGVDEVLSDSEDNISEEETETDNQVVDEAISLPDETELSEELLNEPETEVLETTAEVENLPQEEPAPIISENKVIVAETSNTLASDATSEQLTDQILDNLINNNTQNQNNETTENKSTDIAQTVIDTATTAAAASTATAATAAAAEVSALSAGAAATEDVIKLAGVAGDIVSDVVDKNVQKQQKNLDRIDYAKTDIAPDVTEIPEHIKAMEDLSIAKMEANLEAESSGAFETPLDLSELKPVDTNHEEQEFEQETIDLNEMETVENDDKMEDNIDFTVNLNSINADTPTKINFDEEIQLDETEFEGIDLPTSSSITINEDGTSNFDNFTPDLHFNEIQEESLMDLNPSGIDNLITEENHAELIDTNFDTSVSEEVLAGNKIITENLDSESSSDFDTEDFPAQNEIINLDDMDDFEQTPQIDTSSEVIIEEPLAEEISDNETISDNSAETGNLDISADYESDEISLEDFALLEEQSQNENTLSATENSDIENPQQKTEETAQEWIEDTNYDNLQDIELPTNQEPQEDLIVEPQVENQKVYAVQENSTVISDRNYTVGEIPIDINNITQPKLQDNESLENLYNDNSNIAGGALLQTPGHMGSGSRTSQGGGLFKILGMLVALIIIAVIGFNVAKMFKTPTEETPQPITDDAVPTTPEPVADNNSLDVNPENVVTMDNTTNALANPTTMKQTQAQAKPQAPSQTTKKQGSVMVNVSKLTWEVPDYVSYNPQFKQYFQSIGKSLKLSLTSDLLLATEYAYSNDMKVSITFAKDGAFKNAQIVKSSGSTQIDNIVLQTVNQTLKTLKAPNSVGNDESTTAILKIYF
ncbi:MAG: TonB C-terminal domain-containing protein [Candidatus Gastranaerophilaceae bacterium]